jgi:hypothetical protein
MQMLGTKESAGSGGQSFDTSNSGKPEEMPGPPFPETQNDDIPF